MLAHAFLLAAVTIWGWTFVATRILVSELSPIEIFTLRQAIGLPVLAAVVLLKRVPLRLSGEDLRPLLIGGVVFTAHFLVQTAGLVTTTATNTGWIISVSPLVLAALSFLFLRERIGRGGVAGIGVATLGILLLVSRGRLGDLQWLRSTGDWLVLASAHTWAVYTVVTRNLVRRRHPLAITFLVALVAAGVTACLLLFVPTALARVRTLSPAGAVALLYLGVPALLAHWFWQEGVARLGATRAGLYLYLEPLATLALAVPLLGEPLDSVVIAGGSMVLAGVYLGQRGRTG